MRSFLWLALCGFAACAPRVAIDDSIDNIDESFEEPDDSFPDQDDSADAGTAPSLLTPESLSQETIIGLMRSGAYRGPGYRRVTSRLFPSTVAQGKLVDMFVSEEAFDAFVSVSPDRSGSKAEVPTGTVIVREVYDDTTLTTLTVMVKLKEGSFPLGGDFWYAAADPDGTIRRDANGMPLAGMLANCGTCHLRRANDGFLFGTPDAYLP